MCIHNPNLSRLDCDICFYCLNINIEDSAPKLIRILEETINDLKKENEVLKQQLEGLQPRKLLNCPFCGEKAFLKSHGINGEFFEVGCNSSIDDDCIMPMQDGYETKQEAIKAWNTRAKE